MHVIIQPLVARQANVLDRWRAVGELVDLLGEIGGLDKFVHPLIDGQRVIQISAPETRALQIAFSALDARITDGAAVLARRAMWSGATAVEERAFARPRTELKFAEA